MRHDLGQCVLGAFHEAPRHRGAGLTRRALFDCGPDGLEAEWVRRVDSLASIFSMASQPSTSLEEKCS